MPPAAVSFAFAQVGMSRIVVWGVGGALGKALDAAGSVMLYLSWMSGDVPHIFAFLASVESLALTSEVLA